MSEPQDVAAQPTRLDPEHRRWLDAALDSVPGVARATARPLIRPSLDLAIEINRAVRESDEWFGDPNELNGVVPALAVRERTLDPEARDA